MSSTAYPQGSMPATGLTAGSLSRTPASRGHDSESDVPPLSTIMAAPPPHPAGSDSCPDAHSSVDKSPRLTAKICVWCESRIFRRVIWMLRMSLEHASR